MALGLRLADPLLAHLPRCQGRAADGDLVPRCSLRTAHAVPQQDHRQVESHQEGFFMAVAASSRAGRRATPIRSELESLPEPPERLDAHGWSGKRVREDVRDGVAVAAFSLLTSSAVATVLFLVLRLVG